MANRGGSGGGRRGKRFDPGLYKEYDGPAVAAVIDYLERELGLYARVGRDKYGVDIVVFAGMRPVLYIEVEVCASWSGERPWNYPDCHVLGRKMKWMQGQLGLPCTLYRLSKDLTRAILVQDHVVEESMLELVRNKYNPEGESMYSVPLELTEEIELGAVPGSVECVSSPGDTNDVE